MKPIEEMTRYELKELAKERGMTVEQLIAVHNTKLPVSTSDKLYQNLAEDEEKALTDIHRRITLSQHVTDGSAASQRDTTASGDNGTV